MKLNELYEKLNSLVALEIFSYTDSLKSVEEEFPTEFFYLNNLTNDIFKKENENTQFNILRIFDVYYRNGKPLITDSKYDGFFKFYESSFDDYVDPVMFEPSIDAWEKSEHDIPMGSLDKQTTVDEIEKWNKKKNISGKEILISEKLDGISCCVSFKKGRFIKAVTRGNGKVGDNITQNAIYFDGVVKRLNEPWDCDIRGELVITKDNFKLINEILISTGKDPLKNTRNGVAGLATKYKGRNEEILSLITFIAYDVQVFDMYDTGENVV